MDIASAVFLQDRSFATCKQASNSRQDTSLTSQTLSDSSVYHIPEVIIAAEQKGSGCKVVKNDIRTKMKRTIHPSCQNIMEHIQLRS